jgi:poly [ADP-ribose] polymerase
MLMKETESKVDEAQYLLSSAAPSQANGSKKRAASPDASPVATQDASQAKKPKIVESAKVGDGQNAKSKQIAISVDEFCPLASYQVYIDDDGTIWDASLNQTNASANNNKFYKVQVRRAAPPKGSRMLTVFSCCAMVPVLTSRRGRAGVESANAARRQC